MKRPSSVKSLESLGRIRLSKNFFMRDFLYSEVANFYGISNIPDEPDIAIEAGKHLVLIYKVNLKSVAIQAHTANLNCY